jgi:hypothetical protein
MSNTTPEFVALKVLAIELGIDRSHARKYLKKLGISAVKRRTADSGGQLALCLTRQEADAVLKNRRDQGWGAPEAVVDSETGTFYVIQLVPELDARRIKLGFAADVTDRLAQHQTAAPTATLLRSWPCKRVWEKAAMDCLSSVFCTHIRNEVYECTDLDALIERGNALFSLLPHPSQKVDLSESSPYFSARSDSCQ